MAKTSHKTSLRPVSSEHVVYFCPVAAHLDDDVEINVVADSILHAITANGVDPQDVVISGYNRLSRETDDAKLKYEIYGDDGGGGASEDIQVILADLLQQESRGELTLSIRKKQLARIAELKTASTKSTETHKADFYYFAGHVSMHDSSYGSANPISYAGSDPGATVGVYSRAKLEELVISHRPDTTDTSDSFIARSSQDFESIYAFKGSRTELESAKLFECRLDTCIT